MPPTASNNGTGDATARRARSASTTSTGQYSSRAHPMSAGDPWSPNRHDGTLRKRYSFFGRSNSDASGVEEMPTLHSTMSSRSGPQSPPRPSTALSETRSAFSETRRRATEPLGHIRNSLFGGKKKTSLPNSKDGSPEHHARPGSRSDRIHALFGPSSSEEDDNRSHTRRPTISSPFHFEHITHTHHTDLPPLATVDEKDLPARFWGASAYQSPQRHLNGIRADDLAQKLPAMGIERGAPSSRPTSPLPRELPGDSPTFAAPLGLGGSIEETLFGDTHDPRFDLQTGLQDILPPRSPSARLMRHPSRKSSLGFLNKQRLKYLQEGAPSASASTEHSTDYESQLRVESWQRASPEAGELSQGLASVPEEAERASLRPLSGPLSSLPGHARKSSRSSLRPSDPAHASVSSVATTSDRRSSVKSQRSSFSAFKSPATTAPSSSSETSARQVSFVGDASWEAWEDDVDFVYQQEAESTCNFDWEGAKPQHRMSIAPSFTDSDGGVRLSAWIQPSPLSSNSSWSGSRHDITTSPAGKGSDEMQHRHHHERGSSVGHRGFLAARQGSSETLNRMRPPPPVSIASPSTVSVNVLSPVLSVAGTPEEMIDTTLPPAPESLHAPGLNSTQRLGARNASEPDVSALSSKHQKSSSYGSYEKPIRRGLGGTGDKARWSLASSHSVPDFLHARRNSKPSLHKAVISAPLELLPQSPPAQGGAQEEESPFVPRETQTAPTRSEFTMRRPQTAHERGLMQAAGRLAQRGRPPTPNRFSRLLDMDDGPATAPAPGWF